jgi:hypothetical protein
MASATAAVAADAAGTGTEKGKWQQQGCRGGLKVGEDMTDSLMR